MYYPPYWKYSILLWLLVVLSSCNMSSWDIRTSVHNDSMSWSYSWSSLQYSTGSWVEYGDILNKMQSEWESILLKVDCTTDEDKFRVECDKKKEDVEYLSFISYDEAQRSDFACEKLLSKVNQERCIQEKIKLKQIGFANRIQSGDLDACDQVFPEKVRRDTCKIDAVLNPIRYNIESKHTLTCESLERYWLTQNCEKERQRILQK